MDNKETIETAAAQYGRKIVNDTLTVCALDLASASLLLNDALTTKPEQTEHNECLRQSLVGRLADMLIAVDLICEYIDRKDVREAVRQRMIRLSVQINAAPLP